MCGPRVSGPRGELTHAGAQAGAGTSGVYTNAGYLWSNLRLNLNLPLCGLYTGEGCTSENTVHGFFPRVNQIIRNT